MYFMQLIPILNSSNRCTKICCRNWMDSIILILLLCNLRTATGTCSWENWSRGSRRTWSVSIVTSYLCHKYPDSRTSRTSTKMPWQVVSHSLWTRHRLRNISKVVTKISDGLLSLVTGYRISLLVGIGLFATFFLASMPQKGVPEAPTFYSGALPHVLLLSLIMIVLTNQLQGI